LNHVSNGGRIVTLQSPGMNVSSGDHNFAPGKIVSLPAGGLNKSGAPQQSNLDREANRIGHQKSFSQARVDRPRAGTLRSSMGRLPRSAGGNPRLASTQFHGSAFRPRSGGGFGGGGFGGGGFGRR